MKKHKIWQFNEFNREEAERLAQQAGVSPLVAGYAQSGRTYPARY